MILPNMPNSSADSNYKKQYNEFVINGGVTFLMQFEDVLVG